MPHSGTKRIFFEKYSLLLPLLTYSTQASSETSEKFLMCIPRTKYNRILPQFRITKSHFGTKRKEFCTISGKQTFRVDFLKRVLEVLNSIWGKNAPCWSQKNFLWPYSTTTLYKTPKRYLEWIPRKKCTRFYIQFGIKIP